MNERVVEYRVVYRGTVSWLVGEVQEAIDQGWRPLGGIGVGQTYVYQAMEKYALVNPSETNGFMESIKQGSKSKGEK